MSLITILFLCVLLLICGYSIAYGGRPGLIGALIFLAASILTITADRAGLSSEGINVGIVVVDALCWLALLWLALHSGRYWTIWAAGLQMAAFLTHLSRFLAPDIATRAYDALVAFWSLPILTIMLLGIRKDAQANQISSL